MEGDADRPPAPASHLGTVEDNAAVYAAVARSALDAVVVVDEHGVVVTLNPAAESTFGYSLDEAIGRSIGDLIVPDNLKNAHENGMARYRSTGRPSVLGRRVEMDARCKDGRTIPVELAISEVVLPDRRLFTANLRDLSEVRAAAHEIERQREALHQNEKLAALGSLLAGVAHELNNPLSVVLGQAQMIGELVADIEENAGLRDRARKIETAADRCARIVKSFLAIARQRAPEKRPIAVATLLDGVLELLHYNIKSAGIAVERSYDDTLPDVFGDPDQIHQIVVNLVVNAVQALETVRGARQIVVSTHVSADDTMRIAIRDNGPGVPEEIASRIFEPFFTTKPVGSGTGIGLSVSLGLANSQDGDLQLRASETGGAVFELSLPLATGDGTAADRSAGPAIRQDAAAAAARHGVEPRALVVDDEPDVAELIAEILDTIGFACDVVVSGRKGQDLIRADPGRYDVILCDVRMPDIDGARMFDWLSESHPDLVGRTVFLTGDSLGPNATRFISSCGRPIIEKPFTAADVIGEVVALSQP